MLGRPLHVVSLDYDQCLADHEVACFMRGLDPREVSARKQRDTNYDFTKEKIIKTPQEIAGFIVTRPIHRKHFESLFSDRDVDYILMVGSNRQDMITDFNNGADPKKGKCGSCFAVYEELAKAFASEFNVTIALDKTLYNDAVGGNPPETSFNSLKALFPDDDAFLREFDRLRQAKKSPDNEKILLLFFQMAHVAKANPGRQILFSFADDIPPYIGKLYSYFKEHPEFIPPNVTLKLSVHNYNPDISKDKIINDLLNNIDDNHKSDTGVILDDRGSTLALPDITSRPGPVDVTDLDHIQILAGIKPGLDAGKSLVGAICHIIAVANLREMARDINLLRTCQLSGLTAFKTIKLNIEGQSLTLPTNLVRLLQGINLPGNPDAKLQDIEKIAWKELEADLKKMRIQYQNLDSAAVMNLVNNQTNLPPTSKIFAYIYHVASTARQNPEALMQMQTARRTMGM